MYLSPSFHFSTPFPSLFLTLTLFSHIRQVAQAVLRCEAFPRSRSAPAPRLATSEGPPFALHSAVTQPAACPTRHVCVSKVWCESKMKGKGKRKSHKREEGKGVNEVREKNYFIGKKLSYSRLSDMTMQEKDRS